MSVSPNVCNRSSTLWVLTPLTQAACTTAKSARSARRVGSRRLGKQAPPVAWGRVAGSRPHASPTPARRAHSGESSAVGSAHTGRRRSAAPLPARSPVDVTIGGRSPQFIGRGSRRAGLTRSCQDTPSVSHRSGVLRDSRIGNSASLDGVAVAQGGTRWLFLHAIFRQLHETPSTRLTIRQVFAESDYPGLFGPDRARILLRSGLDNPGI